MSLVEYKKSIIIDFNGIAPNIRQLTNEIKKSSITSECKGIIHYNDEIKIIFVTQLSSQEEVTLNNIISSHTPATNLIDGSLISLIPKVDKIEETSFRQIVSFIYLGSDLLGPIVKIKCISYMNEKTNGYILHCEDVTNAKTIAEASFSNTDEQIVDMGTLSNIPTDEAIIEFSIKNIGGHDPKTYIKNILIYMQKNIKL